MNYPYIYINSLSMLFNEKRYHAQTTYVTQRRLCEQLREEAKRERIKVSIVCKDLVRYITDHQTNDALVVGFPSPKDNPFRDKQQCSLI
ncbi:unnamed protein product [Rotaria sp. Silwood1]|nr:unnamed protein product [Rotaria sp. Silwood1]